MLDKRQQQDLENVDRQMEKTYKDTQKAKNKLNTEMNSELKTLQKRSEALRVYAAKINTMFEYISKPVNIFVQEPLIEVSWDDGTKTRVKSTKEPFDFEKGMAMAFMKKNIYETRKNYHFMMGYFNSIVVGDALIETPEEPEEAMDFSSLTLVELRAWGADVIGFTVPSKLKKASVIKLLIEVTALTD